MRVGARGWLAGSLLALFIAGSARAGSMDTTRSQWAGAPSRLTGGIQAAVTSRPLRVHWAATGIGILATWPLDSRVKQQAVEHGLMPEPLAHLGDEWGGLWAATGILPGIYLAETLRGAPGRETWHRMEFALASLATVGISTQALKFAVGRERPNGRGSRSFPSGHTSAAFGVAEVVRTLYGNLPGIPFYGLAVITGLSRIHDNKHYLSDVVAGAGLGIGFVRGFAIAYWPKGGARAVQLRAFEGLVVVSIPL